MQSVGNDSEYFADAASAIRHFVGRPDITVQEVPAPARLAPHSIALTACPSDTDSDAFSGRFVLLHDPDGVEEWNGTYRVVIFVRADLESELLFDDLLRAVAWSWVTEATSGLSILELGGTVTTNFGESFGSLRDRPSDGFVEVRASWTPADLDPHSPGQSLNHHVQAWVTCLETAGGLTPLPEGVVPVFSARRRG
jgi:hypothetical protein